MSGTFLQNNFLMNKIERQRSETVCHLWCFRDCESASTKLAYSRQFSNKPDKISLKKVLESEVGWSADHRVKKSVSQKNLANAKCETNRSSETQKQFMMFRKKYRIEEQLEEVDKQMSRLTIKYSQKLQQLREIREELEILKKQ